MSSYVDDRIQLDSMGVWAQIGDSDNMSGLTTHLTTVIIMSFEGLFFIRDHSQ